MFDFYESWKRPRDIKRVETCEIIDGTYNARARCRNIDIKWCEGKFGHAYICGEHREQLYSGRVKTLDFSGYGRLHVQTFLPIEPRYTPKE